MKRRNFLGLLGGTAVAGPSIAAETASKLSASNVWAHKANYLTQGQGPLADYAQSGAPANDISWHASRIQSLRDLITGKVDDHDAHYRRANRVRSGEMADRAAIDALRSVSMQHKYSMLVDAGERRARRANILDAEFELSNLLNLKF